MPPLYVIEYQQEEFLTKLWEFSHVYLEKVPEKYDKESVLLLFCRWAVKSIMEEDMEEELAELKQLIEESAHETYSRNNLRTEDLQEAARAAETAGCR